MAEFSLFHTTGTSGDGASPYTQTQVTDWLRRTFLDNPATECVHKNYGNALALTPVNGASPRVDVGTGAAIVYGFPYENTATVQLSFTKPSVGTTGYRIVLRMDWTAHTVRLVLKSSSDGVSAIPAVTQTAGTTWEVSLATFTCTTGGVITLTDTRAYAHPNIEVQPAMMTYTPLNKAGDTVNGQFRSDRVNTLAAGLYDNAGVVLAPADGSVPAVGFHKVGVEGAALYYNSGNFRKINNAGSDVAIWDGGNDGAGSGLDADLVDGQNPPWPTAFIADNAIDDTKAGNRVAQFYRRQGGSASNWSTGGASNHTPTAIRVQWGVIDLGSLGAGAGGTGSVTFPVAFSDVPHVMMHGSPYKIEVGHQRSGAGVPTASGFNYEYANGGGSPQPARLLWLAIGPE